MKVYLGENEIHAICLSVKVAFVLQVFLAGIKKNLEKN